MPDSPTARARIDWGDLARREPFDRDFGGGRGRPIDRHYIDAFLDANRGAIRGHVLEVGDDHYARRFGGAQVHAVDVVDHVQTPNTTIFGDLSDSVTLPPARFDCIICTQTLHLLFDVHATLANLHRALVVGGVLLVTVPGISQIVRYDMARWGDFWRFTTASLQRLLFGAFGTHAEIAVHSRGNVRSAAAFLYGLALEDVDAATLEGDDPEYQLVVAARAIRASRW